jgi:AcrR family transcriptional regulator
MRRLADQLGVRAGALYWHFPNKDDLCRAVVERVASELRWSAPSRDEPVREQLRHHVLQLRAHWRRHPSAVALGRRFAPIGAGAFSEAGIGLLVDLGYERAEAREQWRALVWIVLGFFFVEDGVTASEHHRPIAGQPGRYVVEIGADDEVLDTERLFARVLDLALDGIERGVPHRA